MKIIKLKGGLGNQLFQYSFANLIKLKTGDNVQLDMSYYEYCNNDSVRKPRILKMDISLPIASKNDIGRICHLKHYGNPQTNGYRLGIFAENIINNSYYFEKSRAYINPDSILEYKYFDGYWQSWRYVDPVWDIIRKDLRPNYILNASTNVMVNEVEGHNSVFVGVRKGDYATEKNHYGSFDNTYYQKAMDYISSNVENPIFYVFSNDISWVKQNIDFNNRNVVYREPEDTIDDFEDFIIMSHCKHAIIVNSTFHWWGARINDSAGKIVIAPKKWWFDDKPIDIVPPHWIKL